MNLFEYHLWESTKTWLIIILPLVVIFLFIQPYISLFLFCVLLCRLFYVKLMLSYFYTTVSNSEDQFEEKVNMMVSKVKKELEENRKIFEEVEGLGFDKDDFMVLGSGILEALGIREAGDIDLLVKPALFEELKSRGWEYEVIEIEGRPREKIHNGRIEAFKDFWWGTESFTPEVGIARAEKIKSINFLPLQTLLEVKRHMKRDKDVADVALIEAYLAKQ